MVNVFSFCLYGPENPKYYTGLLENIFLAGKYFPTWKVYVYYAPDVTERMLEILRPCSSVMLRPTGVLGEPNMIKRFFAIDEPDVDIMMVRDADSRIHWKDRWAIREFLSSPNFIAHTVRDHKDHTAKMMGGIWGIRKSAGLHMETEYANYVEDKSLGHRHAHDQNFLADVVYPKVLPKLLVHYSFHRRAEETAVAFPFEWNDVTYCGRAESIFYDIPQPPIKHLPFLPNVPINIKEDEPPKKEEVKIVSFRQDVISTQPLNFLPRK